MSVQCYSGEIRFLLFGLVAQGWCALPRRGCALRTWAQKQGLLEWGSVHGRLSNSCFLLYLPYARMAGSGSKGEPSPELPCCWSPGPAAVCGKKCRGQGAQLASATCGAGSARTLASVPGNAAARSISLGFIRATESEVRPRAPAHLWCLTHRESLQFTPKPMTDSTNAASS